MRGVVKGVSRFAMVAIACLTAEKAAAELVWLRDTNRKIAISYDDARWQRSSPAESASLFVINWKAKSGGGLVATCALQALASTFAQAIGEEIHANKDVIAESLMANLRKRDLDAALELAEPAYADNRQAIHLVRRMSFRSFDRAGSVTAEMLFTTWRGEEITLECAYDDVLKDDGMVEDLVGSKIAEILRSLHFER